MPLSSPPTFRGHLPLRLPWGRGGGRQHPKTQVTAQLGLEPFFVNVPLPSVPSMSLPEDRVQEEEQDEVGGAMTGTSALELPALLELEA